MSQRDPPAYWLWFAFGSAVIAMLMLVLMLLAPNERFVRRPRVAVTPTLPD